MVATCEQIEVALTDHVIAQFCRMFDEEFARVWEGLKGGPTEEERLEACAALERVEWILAGRK
jgi:hypothetical protein